MDTIKEIQDEQAKGIHSLFNACMYRDECRAKEAEVERMKASLAELARYFTSGNDQLSAPLFELRHPGGNVWRLYADGRCEGLPDGVVVVNHALPIIHELIAKQIPRGSVANE